QLRPDLACTLDLLLVALRRLDNGVVDAIFQPKRTGHRKADALDRRLVKYAAAGTAVLLSKELKYKPGDAEEYTAQTLRKSGFKLNSKGFATSATIREWNRELSKNQKTKAAYQMWLSTAQRDLASKMPGLGTRPAMRDYLLGELEKYCRE